MWAFDESGRFGRVVDFRFDSEEGRDLVTGIADQLDLRQRRGAAEKTGLVFGVVFGALTVIGIVVVLVLLATGRF